MLKPTLVVMAAGMGLRYGGFKQIESIGPNGETLVEYSVYDALRAGFGNIVFIIREEIEKVFRENIGRIVEGLCDTMYVFQSVEDLPGMNEFSYSREKPWGTAHAILTCREVVDLPFAVINADDFYGPTSFQALVTFLQKEHEEDGVDKYCMVGYLLKDTLSAYGHVARGVCTLDRSSYLLDIRERKRIQNFNSVVKFIEDGENWVQIPKDTVVSMNMWGFQPSLFSELETRFLRFIKSQNANLGNAEFLIPDVVNDLIGEGKATVKVLPAYEKWCGITYQKDKPLVKKVIGDSIFRGDYPESLWVNNR